MDFSTPGTGDVRVVKKDPITNGKSTQLLIACVRWNSLAPVRPQHRGKLEIIHRILATLQDRDDLKSVSVDFVKKTLRNVEICGNLVRMRVIAGEHEELEASI